MSAIQVSSIRHTAIAAGLVEIFTYARETKGKKIEAANRTRALLIPELNIEGLPAKFSDFVRSQLYTIAKVQLADLWKENGNQWTETDSELWTVDALLAYAARTQESQKLSAELVKQHMAGFLAECIDEKKRGAVLDALISCAAPTPSLSLKQCQFLAPKLEAWVEEQEEDAQHWSQRAVLRKIQKHSEALAALDNAF